MLPAGPTHHSTLTISREGEASTDVLGCEVGEIGEDLPFRHPGSEILEDIVHGNAQPADARLSATLARLNRDDISVVHMPMVGASFPAVNSNHAPDVTAQWRRQPSAESACSADCSVL